MRTTKRKTLATLLPAVAAAASIMVAGVAGNVAGTYVNSTPRIGHIIAFAPGSDVGANALVMTNRQGGSVCAFDLDVVHRFGGSLVVETLTPGEANGFLVHWAGQRTSEGAADCGSDAMLTIGRSDLDRLAASAGGYDEPRIYAGALGR